MPSNLHFNLFDLFWLSGPIKWPLGFCSILALGILIERLVMLNIFMQKEDSAFALLREKVIHGEVFPKSDPSVVGAPITAIIETLMMMRGATDEAIWQAAEIAISQQRLRLRRYMNALATIGSIAPFIGLFGTVLGVMESFASMRVGGLNNERMAGGISEALSATALGLLVAIPSVVAYNFLLGRVQTLLLHVHSHVAQLIPLLNSTPERRKQEA